MLSTSFVEKIILLVLGTTSSIEKCASRIKRNFNVETLPQFKDTHKLNLQKTAASKQRHASNLGLQPSISLGYIYNQTIVSLKFKSFFICMLINGVSAKS